jgi:hypothetical protein
MYNIVLDECPDLLIIIIREVNKNTKQNVRSALSTHCQVLRTHKQTGGNSLWGAVALDTSSTDAKIMPLETDSSLNSVAAGLECSGLLPALEFSLPAGQETAK